MNVLIVINRYHTNLVPWVEALVQSKHVVKIVSKKVGPSEDHSLVVPEVLDPEEIDCTVAADILERIRPDLIILRDKSEGFRFLVKEGKKRGAKTVFYEQRDYYRPYGFPGVANDFKRLSRRLRYGFPVRAITPSVGNVENVPRWFVDFFRVPMKTASGAQSRSYIQNGAPTVLCVGKIAHEVKRHTWVIDSLEEINVECNLLIVGAGDDRKDNPEKRDSGYYDEVWRRVSDNKIKGEVDIIEDLPHSELLKLYTSCDIMVLPSVREAFGISPVEAMAGGCAVVATSASGSTGYITHGYDGLHFRSDSFSDLVAQLNRLLSDYKEIERMGKNAVSTISKKHDYGTFVSFMERLANGSSWKP